MRGGLRLRLAIHCEFATGSGLRSAATTSRMISERNARYFTTGANHANAFDGRQQTNRTHGVLDPELIEVIPGGFMADCPDFSLVQLQYFVLSAEMGNISDAAKALHASQSAVSTGVQRLERKLGTQLFFRNRTKGVSLTPSGRVLLADARSLLGQARRLRDRGREWQGGIHGELEAASLHSIAAWIFPPVLSKLKQRHPELTVMMHEGTVDRVCELLRSGGCELALTSRLPDPDFTFISLARVPVVAFVADGDPLAAHGFATLPRLATRPLLVVDSPADDAAAAAERSDFFTRAGAPIPEVVQMSSLSTMLAMVAADVGFALLNQPLARNYALDTSIRPVEIIADAPNIAAIGVTTLSDMVSSRRAHEFISAVSTVLPTVFQTVDDQGDYRDEIV
ncbi:LysR family transcriptional regulator [Nocardia sp. CA-107356]|uniref:LysR family transcriptional regulator n=1 Tax=Nocardia sp. CA-107356 TaxID=3239972 RepID=UPI003D8A589B